MKSAGLDDEAAGIFEEVEEDFLLGDVAGVFRGLHIMQDVAEVGGQLGGEFAGVGYAGVVLPLAVAGRAGYGRIRYY